MGTDFRKVPQHSETKLWSKRLAFVIVFFIQELYAKRTMGKCGNLGQLFETIVFVNTLYLLTEAFLAFFVGLLLPPIQFALSFKKF